MPQFLSSIWASHDVSNRLTSNNRHSTNASTNDDGSTVAGETKNLNRLLNSTACNVSLGLLLLLVGIIVTSMTLKEYKNTNKIFLLGPILVGAGAIGLAKALLKKYHYGAGEHRRIRRQNRQRSHQQRSDIRDGTDQLSLSCLRDEPPPYDIVAIVTSRHDSQPGALLPTVSSPSAPDRVFVPSLPIYSETDPIPPPPKYEEVVAMEATPRPIETVEERVVVVAGTTDCNDCRVMGGSELPRCEFCHEVLSESEVRESTASNSLMTTSTDDPSALHVAQDPERVDNELNPSVHCELLTGSDERTTVSSCV